MCPPARRIPEATRPICCRDTAPIPLSGVAFGYLCPAGLWPRGLRFDDPTGGVYARPAVALPHRTARVCRRLCPPGVLPIAVAACRLTAGSDAIAGTIGVDCGRGRTRLAARSDAIAGTAGVDCRPGWTRLPSRPDAIGGPTATRLAAGPDAIGGAVSGVDWRRERCRLALAPVVGRMTLAAGYSLPSADAGIAGGGRVAPFAPSASPSAVFVPGRPGLRARFGCSSRLGPRPSEPRRRTLPHFAGYPITSEGHTRRTENNTVWRW
jgi:hypothetical protein